MFPISKYEKTGAITQKEKKKKTIVYELLKVTGVSLWFKR